MVKKDKSKTTDDIKKSFYDELSKYKNKKADLEKSFSSLNSKETITVFDDENINSLIDSCYSSISILSELCNELFDIDSDAFLKLYNELLLERNELSTLKDSITRVTAHKWREELEKQIERNQELQNNIQHYNEDNSQMAASIQDLKDKVDDTLRRAESSQKAVEESSSKFITIVALLVSLLAIIFGNLSQFISSKITWQSIVIVNSSILLSTCLIIAIIENIHLFSLKLLFAKDNVNKISRHQIIFNVFIGAAILVVASILIVAIAL